MRASFANIVFSFLSITSCSVFSNKNKDQDDDAVARVGESFLYSSDLESLIKPGISKQDSSDMANQYIITWIKNQLLLQQAEKYLPDTKEIDKQVEDYRASMIIFEYQSSMIREKMDTTVSEEELKSFYDEHQSDFTLDDDLANINYVIIDKNSSKKDSIKIWMKTENLSKNDKLKELCSRVAMSYSLDPQWVLSTTIKEQFPFPVLDLDTYLSDHKYPVLEDSAYLYFLRINDYKRKNTVSPLEYVQDQIKQMILNKRKMDFLDKLNQDLFMDASQPNDYEILKNE